VFAASGFSTHVVTGRCLGNGHKNQKLQTQFRASDDERCAAQNMLSLQQTLE
jgi:hypothetical protein